MYKTTTETRTSTQQKIIVMVVMVLAVALLPAFGSIAFRGFVALSSNTSTSSMPLPVAHYKFDGNGADSSGNGLNGVPAGLEFASSTSTATSTARSFAVFDGVSRGVFTDRLRVSDNNLLDLNAFTLSGWFYFDGDIGSARLIAKEFDNTKWDYRLLTLDGGVAGFQDALLVQINKAGGGILQVQVNNALQNFKNKWVFLSATYDGNNLILYVDGQEIGRTSGATAIKNSDAGLGIGAGDSGNAPFKGKIDNVRIYNRALSKEQINTLFNNDLDISNAEWAHLPGRNIKQTLNFGTTFEYEINGQIKFGSTSKENKIGATCNSGSADVNRDGVVNALDIQMVINRSLGNVALGNCDVDGNGVVNALDIQMVINAALGVADGCIPLGDFCYFNSIRDYTLNLPTPHLESDGRINSGYSTPNEQNSITFEIGYEPASFNGIRTAQEYIDLQIETYEGGKDPGYEIRYIDGKPIIFRSYTQYLGSFIIPTIRVFWLTNDNPNDLTRPVFVQINASSQSENLTYEQIWERETASDGIIAKYFEEFPSILENACVPYTSNSESIEACGQITDRNKCQNSGACNTISSTYPCWSYYSKDSCNLQNTQGCFWIPNPIDYACKWEN